MSPIRYISLFSGIEAATVAWHPLGWQPVAFAEIDKFCCELLVHYYPEVPNLGDITKITKDQVEALGHVDVVVFGSPCQGLSCAGMRKGINDDPRSNLFFAGEQVARWSKARFTLWENVPGAFSSNHGDDFGAVVGSLVGLAGVPVPSCRWRNEGAAVGPLGMLEWSVLDAQFFGVAQRRRRVFALLDIGDWAGRPPILLEPCGLRGDPPARGEAGKEVAGGLGAGPQGSCSDTERMTFLPELVEPIAANEARTYTHEGNMYRLRNCVPDIVPALTSKMAKGTGGPAGDECQNLIAFDPTQVTHPENRSNPQPGAPYHTLAKGQAAPCVAIPIMMRDACRTAGTGAGTAGIGIGSDGDPAGTIGATVRDAVAFEPRYYTRDNKTGGAPSDVAVVKADASKAGDSSPHICTGMAIRRLTPRECERLQGFPDDYTLVPRGKKHKPAADGPRYRAIGNSMAVPVMRWIGERIQHVLDGSAK